MYTSWHNRTVSFECEVTEQSDNRVWKPGAFSQRTHTALVVVVSQNKENVVQEVQKVSLVELVGNCWIACRKVVDDFQTDGEAHVCNISHRVFESPYNTVHDQSQLCGRKFHES